MRPRHGIATTLAGAALVFATAAGGTTRTPVDRDYGQEIFFAVLEGLYADGVQNEAVDVMVALEDGEAAHFVQGCPICMPAIDALRVYRQRPIFQSSKPRRDTFGPGLTEAQLATLRSPDRKARLKLVGGLVERWVERRLESQRPTPEERAAWRREMEIGRKKGMAILTGNQARARASGVAAPSLEMDGCAFCDGANGACDG